MGEEKDRSNRSTSTQDVGPVPSKIDLTFGAHEIHILHHKTKIILQMVHLAAIDHDFKTG